MDQDLHYYEAHEPEYQRRLRRGQVGWDAGNYDDIFMKPFVVRSLASLGFPTAGSRALDLGCGTGALSCYLAEQGFDVVGLDIAPTAIAHAIRESKQRGLDIAFEVSDVCREPFPPDPYDLILDGHLLHCIVFEHERDALLRKIRRSLSGRGQFWVETMLLESDHEPDPAWHLDERGVVWARCKNGQSYAEAIRRDGAWWLPQRLIARSSAQLLEELRRAGFSVVDWESYEPEQAGHPGGFRARCAAN
ncbi:MAG: methyltransferase domain-containing protein [Planctomycetota bacterium]